MPPECEAVARSLGRVQLVSETFKNMDQWLGDASMPITAAIGGSLDAYCVDGEDLGWGGWNVHAE